MSKKIKASPDSPAGVVIASNVVRMHGTEENFVMADDKGITISGPVSFVDGIENVRAGALWAFNNAMQLMIPSTMATPSPVMRLDPPIAAFARIAKDVAVMTALLAAVPTDEEE